MAARFDAAADQLSRTTALPGITLFTMCGWFQKSVETGTWGTLLCYGATTGALLYYLGLSDSGTTFALSDDVTSLAGTTVMNVGIWYHAALVVAGTGAGQFTGYVNGVQEITLDGKGTIPSQGIIVGQDPSNEPFNGRAAAVKIWAAALTVAELQAEMRQYLPVRVANLTSWHPLLLHTDLAQYGATWTAAGTLTTEDGPPIAWSVRAPLMQRRLTTAATLAMHPTVQLQAVASGLL